MRFLDRISVPLLVSLTAVYLLTPHFQMAQTPQRRTIGIALSGGGALGLAHIGVLRYLEERRIPVDRIAGTSMGGLLGGLYATGHDAGDLERIVNEADWQDLLRATPRFEDRIATEKQPWNRVTGSYSIPLGKGLTLPAGINSGQALVGLLSSETAAYWDVENFDDLPIPFRCVATDLISGEPMVLQKGHLPQALRATMAIPGIFAPVERDGRILVDGGLVNNFPTDVAKEMGSDVVIGVTLRVAPPGAEELRNLTDVVRQTANIAVMQNEKHRIPLADVHIAVEFVNQRAMDFSDPKSLIQIGYQAAAKNQIALDKLAVSAEQWQQYVDARKTRQRNAPAEGPISSVSAAQPHIQRSAFQELSRKADGSMSNSEVRTTLGGLTAAADLPNVFYGWHTERERTGYHVEIETRRFTEVFVRPSFFYQFSPDEPSRPTLKMSASAMFKNSYKSRFVGALSVGRDPAFQVEYYHPFGGSAFFIAPGLALERSHFYQYTGKMRSEQVRNRFSGNLYFGIGTWRHVQLRTGARAGLDRYAGQTADTGFVNPEITGIINSQDSGVLPTRGIRLNASAGWSFRKNSFPYLEMNFDHFQPVGREVSLFAVGRADTSMGRKLNVYDQFSGGGFGQLDAYRHQEIRGDTLLMAGGGLLYRGLNPKNSAFRPILGTWYQAASTDPWSANSLFKESAAVSVLMPSPLGIASVTVASDLRGSTRWRFSLGSFWNRP
jgi:NTE family protein